MKGEWSAGNNRSGYLLWCRKWQLSCNDHFIREMITLVLESLAYLTSYNMQTQPCISVWLWWTESAGVIVGPPSPRFPLFSLLQSYMKWLQTDPGGAAASPLQTCLFRVFPYTTSTFTSLCFTVSQAWGDTRGLIVKSKLTEMYEISVRLTFWHCVMKLGGLTPVQVLECLCLYQLLLPADSVIFECCVGTEITIFLL